MSDSCSFSRPRESVRRRSCRSHDSQRPVACTHGTLRAHGKVSRGPIVRSEVLIRSRECHTLGVGWFRPTSDHARVRGTAIGNRWIHGVRLMATRKTPARARDTVAEPALEPDRQPTAPKAPVRRPRKTTPETQVVAVSPEHIRVRAYFLSLERNGRPEDPLADWLGAERELTGHAGQE